MLPIHIKWFWIGYNDIEVEGTFKWSDGMPDTYQNWDNGEGFGSPKENEDCVMLQKGHKHKYHWHDAPCSRVENFVCKFY